MPRRDTLLPGTIYVSVDGTRRAVIAREDPRNIAKYEFPSVAADQYNMPEAAVMHVRGDIEVEVVTPAGQYTGKRFVDTAYNGTFLVINKDEAKKMRNARNKQGTPVALFTGEIRFTSQITSDVADPQPGDVVKVKGGGEGILLRKSRQYLGYVSSQQIVVVPTPDNEWNPESAGIIRWIAKDAILKEWN